MSDRTAVDAQGQPEGGEPLEGIVLFDPTPRPPLEIEEPEEKAPGGIHRVLILLLIAVLGVGGLELRQSRAPAPAVATVARASPPAAARPMDTVLPRPPWPGESTSSDAAPSVAMPAPRTLALAGGDGQAGDSGELLRDQISVRVTDAHGNPVPYVDVRFSVQGGGGSVAPSATRTDSSGLASTFWRLGTAPGRQLLTASSSRLPGTATFTASASAKDRPAVPENRTVVPASRSVRAAPVRVAPIRLAIGGSHVCTLVGATAECRGANDRGQTPSVVDGRFAALAAGIAHSCALDGSGVAMCWGANDAGQLGDGSHSDRDSPVRTGTELRFSVLAAGASHTCGLAGGGLPYCWGGNVSGQLGDGSRADAPAPRAVSGGHTFTALAAGWNHTCALTADGRAFCWGLNSDGQLGDGSRLDRLVPTFVRESLTSLAAGSAHTCGISNSEVLCWGDNRFGQLGDGTNEPHTWPTAVSGLPARPRDVTTGAVHTCALLEDGSAWCWGQNLHGQLGDGSTQNRNRPTRVAGDITFQSLEAGGAETCGSSTGGNEYCWGLNQNGQLGDRTRENRSSPTPVEPPAAVTSLATR